MNEDQKTTVISPNPFGNDNAQIQRAIDLHSGEPKIDLIVWDIETTGFDAPKDKITEIGAIIVRGDQIEERSWIIKTPGLEIPAHITELTGIDQALIDASGRPFREVLDEFMPLFDGDTPHVTHNGIKFDIPFLLACIKDLRPDVPQEAHDLLAGHLRKNAFDTSLHVKAKKINMLQNEGESLIEFYDRVKVPIVAGVKHSLNICCEEYGIPLEGIVRHRALPDVRLTHELYKKLQTVDRS